MKHILTFAAMASVFTFALGAAGVGVMPRAFTTRGADGVGPIAPVLGIDGAFSRHGGEGVKGKACDGGGEGTHSRYVGGGRERRDEGGVGNG